MSASTVSLYLAPMEGVIDAPLRKVYARLGGIDHFVTEFIRVTNHVHSDPVLHRFIPELWDKSLQVTPQLLGSDPEFLALNAKRLVELGAQAIDLNFGCPAKTVNRHDGGATLLKSSDRLFTIAKSVREALPLSVPVSAKIRLGFNDPSSCLENSVALQEAGVSKLTVHCRTKMDMYKPPAYWEWIPKIKSLVKIPVVANGEIWNLQDFLRCKEITGVQDFMIGRGALQDPLLFQKIKFYLQHGNELAIEAPLSLVWNFFEDVLTTHNSNYAQARTKQWLRSMAPLSKQHQDIFNELKVIQDPVIFRERIQSL